MPAGALLQPFLRREKSEYISIEMYVFIAGIMIYLNLVKRIGPEQQQHHQDRCCVYWTHLSTVGNHQEKDISPSNHLALKMMDDSIVADVQL